MKYDIPPFVKTAPKPESALFEGRPLSLVPSEPHSSRLSPCRYHQFIQTSSLFPSIWPTAEPPSGWQYMTHKLVQPRDDARAAERVVALITRYAVRFDPVIAITFYSAIVRSLAPIRADLAAQIRPDDIPER